MPYSRTFIESPKSPLLSPFIPLNASQEFAKSFLPAWSVYGCTVKGTQGSIIALVPPDMDKKLFVP